VERFSNLNEFGSVIEGLDDYQSLPITVKIGDRELTGKVRGMTNITDGHITMAVGEKYPIFDHKLALGYVEKELQRRSCSVHGNVTIVGDTTYSHILFDGLTVNDKDSKVELGVEFVNPMDKKTRFLGHGYTWRQICSNGAGIKSMLPNLLISERHTSNMSATVPVLIHEFIGNSLEQTNHMQVLIDNASKMEVVFESPQQVYETLKYHFDGVTERHIKRIAEQVTTLKPTRYDLFNASNYVTSHYSISPDVRSEIDRKAELFINTGVPFTPVKVEVKVIVNTDPIARPIFHPDFEGY
jgi:hypothetical protein